MQLQPESNAQSGPRRRTVVAVGALAGASLALGTGGTSLAAAGTEAAGATGAGAAGRADGTAAIRSRELSVLVDRAFPRIVSYTRRSDGAVLHGQETPSATVRIDGTDHTPKVTASLSGEHADYTLAFEAGTRITVRVSVEGMCTHWRVTAVEDTPALRVGTLEFPGLALLSVRSDQPGAALLAARIELDKAKSGDTLIAPESDTPESSPVGCAYAVVAHDRLAGAFETNTVHDKPDSGAGTTWDNGRMWRSVVKGEGFVKAQLVPGQWTHRAAGSPVGATEPLPYATVVVTGDRNGDGVVDWQDAAIAFRDIMVEPLGAEEQHLRVVPHIPFNFASQATNPFLDSLDEVKRIHLATDGLRQYTLLKGYASEGHDSAHPDYAGNYNKRAGGLKDLNTLVREGRTWNSDFSVHINATESYPVAHAFSETLVDENDEQWDWLDQSYRIDPRRDLVSGDIVARLGDLRRQADPALNTLYIDVFRESGWNSDRLQRAMRDQGWHITTEWGHGLERSSLWSHWATEPDYGPDTSRGINSRLIRFVRHHQKDVFADKWPSLLPTARTTNYEGWTGKTDWHAFHEPIWTNSLPAKYLQAQPIRTWSENEVTFFGGTRTVAAEKDGKLNITTDGRLVHDGSAYLLPWEPRRATDPEKLYHWNPEGGRTTWQLPRGWSGASRVFAYRLTDQGRAGQQEIRVSGGKITLKAKAGTAYVVYRSEAPADRDPQWGQFTPLHNPAFHAGDLTGWQHTGDARVELSELGDHELVLAGGKEASVSQTLRGLRTGRYVASVQVEVGAKVGERRRAALEVSTADGRSAVNFTEESTAANYVAADRKHGTRFQRMFTYFTVPAGGGRTVLTLRAGAGAATVRFDRVRVVPGVPCAKAGALVFEDFENVPQGWGPFVKGDAGDVTDPRTHLAQKHAPFTQAGWNGKVIDDVIDGNNSLKSRAENSGLVYRTVDHTVRFEPGRTYRVSFRYESEAAGEYAWITAVDEPATRELERKPLPKATEPTELAYEFTAPATGRAWVGLRRTGEATAEFVLDGFEVREV